MWLSLIALGLVPLGAIAQGCGMPFSGDSEDIDTQDDLDSLKNNCTTLRGYCQITSNYTRPFVLPGIANVSTLSGGSDTSRPLNIPSFEMADLEYVDYLWLYQLDKLETFSVPKLASAGSVTLDIGSHIDTLEMPVLEQIEYLDLKGNFTECVVCCTPAGVSLPELTYLADPWQLTFLGGSNFSLWGEAVPLDLPKLATIDGSIVFEGNNSSLSLPSLDNIQGNLTIIAGSPLSIDIPELGYAEIIRLTGQIKRVKLPGLVNWRELHVDTDLIFDCDAFMEEYDRLPGKRVTTCLSGDGTVEDSTEEADETDGNDNSTSQDENSNWESSDDTGDKQDGGDNGSAPLSGRRDITAMLATSLAVAGVIAFA
ncbi:hypothetical protein BDV06DRAFT_218232 [Aspergillus oleicola]